MKTIEDRENWLLEYAKNEKFSNVPLSQFIFNINPVMYSLDEAKYNYNLDFLLHCTKKLVGTSCTLGLTGDLHCAKQEMKGMKLFKILRINSKGELLFEFANSNTEKPQFDTWINPQNKIDGWFKPKEATEDFPAYYHFVTGRKSVKQYIKEARTLHLNLKDHFDTQAFSVHEVEVKSYRIAFVTFAKNISYFMWGGMTSEMIMHEKPVFVEKL